MERLLLDRLGGPSAPRSARPVLSSSELEERTRFLQDHAIEGSTRKNYTTGARDYVSFCINHKLPIDPTPETLSKYIAYTSKFIASGPKYLTGAKHFLNDIFPDFEKNRTTTLVQTTIAGSRKIRADPVRRKLPLRIAHLRAFYELYLHDKSFDKLLFITILACMFFGCHRAGELIPRRSTSMLDLRKIIKRASLISHHAKYALPYHKGDRFYRGSEVLLSHQDIVDPVRLLRKYCGKRDKIHGAHPYLFLREDGSLPSRSWFESIFFKLLNRDYGGHSVRAGSATFYASLGVSETIIMAIGRWSSEAWKIYIRDHPTVRAEIQLACLRNPHHL